MSRPTTKEELVNVAWSNYQKMNEMIAAMSESEMTTPFCFGEQKKEAHWKRDKNVRDILVHLYEWHQLLLDWVPANLNEEEKPFLPKPYNWKTYGKLNDFFWSKHQDTTMEEAEEMLEQSHRKTMELLESFTDEQLFTKGYYKWTGTTSLGAYFISNTSSHYDWAMKKMKAHKNNCKNS